MKNLAEIRKELKGKIFTELTVFTPDYNASKRSFVITQVSESSMGYCVENVNNTCRLTAEEVNDLLSNGISARLLQSQNAIYVCMVVGVEMYVKVNW